MLSGNYCSRQDCGGRRNGREDMALPIERAAHLKAAQFERSNSRSDYADGFKNKTMLTRLGAIDLDVQQVRGGGFYPSALEQVKTRR